MSGGLEVVVRPVVLPNIRPTAPRVLPPEDDPEKGIATLGGSGGRLIDLTYSFQSSTQRETPKYEQERTFDVDRIHQKKEDGSINKDNYVDVERVKKIYLGTADGVREQYNFAIPPTVDNIETTKTDQVRKAE
jgi:hypothetical protein